MEDIDDDLDDVMEDASDILSRFQPSTAKHAAPRSSTIQDVEPSQAKPIPPNFTPVNAPISEPRTTNMRREIAAVELQNDEFDSDGYENFEEWSRVTKVLREIEGQMSIRYAVRFGDNHNEILLFEKLLQAPGGQEALTRYQAEADGSSEESESSSSEERMEIPTHRKTPSAQRHSRSLRTSARSQSSASLRLTLNQTSSDESDNAQDESDAILGPSRRSTRSTRFSGRNRAIKTARRRHQLRSPSVDEGDESSESSDLLLLKSDVVLSNRKRKRNGSRGHLTNKRMKTLALSTRHSTRMTRAQKSMQEVEVDDIYRSNSSDKASAQPRITAVREVFKQSLSNSPFRRRHNENCETCGRSSSSGLLICCQGCSLAYHKACLGNRNGREHLVTKVGDADFVLQCRRCVNFPQKKDHLAPSLSNCQICQQIAPSCKPFRKNKTTLQEQKDRDENGGEDPISVVSTDLINNADNLLFRCVKCWRGFHFYCLPNRDQYHQDLGTATKADLAENRYNQHRLDWLCKDCADMPAEVGGLVAWRPTNIDANHDDAAALGYHDINEDDKEYLIKWKELSYARSDFMPGAWVWGVTSPTMRIAFAKRETGPKPRIEDAIPEEFLRIDIVLDVKYTNRIDIRTEEVDKARIKEVKRVYIKYKGLGYEDAVWEIPPTPEEGDRWIDFVSAYNDWVLGRWLKLPKQTSLRARVEKAREQPFSRLEKEKQPAKLVGGEMMKYQIEGLNWLYYRWHQKQNGILADEMGLGKTIQVIAFLAMMLEEHNCCPFLVVVPNSTCPNWRRELKKWAPSLRVVTFFGTSAARDIAYNHELYPENSKELKAHVVVTSYEAAADDNCRKFFRSVQWQGLIVDEGQRLKNDRSLLHVALKTLKIPYRILLTGTPLQNNAKELFNLLEFLDDNISADQLEQDYEEMNEANIRKLHDLIRPFILRRTKAGVLSFLPTMAQIIVPVSMSAVQKKFYVSILEKSPELLKSLFRRGPDHEPGKSERVNLNNILMQLRKCLCHPYVYSREIEERDLGGALLHHNLVQASAKLQLLDILLPKLKERGHRVLIFSQFLDMLDIVEDFLDGLGLSFNRLDGTISSLEKQKRIDQFNRDGSDLFAFLLSTRSGGVGINLATADTVIILDPDFNPHQDIQALSRAHRIGQKKKVLCFQLMTRNSVEEKIMQIGKKKMALDHVIVEQLDADEAEEKDLESILRHGAAQLFTGDNDDQDIKYDGASVEKLLDRSQAENTGLDEDRTAESQFSFARVWANNSGALEEGFQVAEEIAPDPSVWDKILQARERAAAAEAAAREQALGRGRRARITVDYGTKDSKAADGPDLDPVEPTKIPRMKLARRMPGDSDTDFQPDDRADSPATENDADEPGPEELLGLQNPPVQVKGIASQGPAAQAARVESAKPQPPRPRTEKLPKPFRRAQLLPPRLPQFLPSQDVRSNPDSSDELGRFRIHERPSERPDPPIVLCPGCGKTHHQGSCPLKVAGVEYCNLCGLAHYGIARTCPHIGSETQVILMLEAIKHSREPPHVRDAALRYLRGVKGALVQQKKKNREKALVEQSTLAHNKDNGVARAGNVAGAATPPQHQVASANSNKNNTGGTTGRFRVHTSASMARAAQGQAGASRDVEQRLLTALQSND